jgi:hypothetical protein
LSIFKGKNNRSASYIKIYENIFEELSNNTHNINSFKHKASIGGSEGAVEISTIIWMA